MPSKNKFRIFAWIIILIGVIYCLVSCSPINRLNRLQNKHPYLFTSKTDTILHRDTIQVVVPGTQIDTSVHFLNLIDTVVITKNGLTTTVWLKGDTVHIHSGNDTVYIDVPYEVKVPYTKYEVAPAPPKKPFLWWLGPLFEWLVLIAIVYLLFFWKPKSD